MEAEYTITSLLNFPAKFFSYRWVHLPQDNIPPSFRLFLCLSISNHEEAMHTNRGYIRCVIAALLSSLLVGRTVCPGPRDPWPAYTGSIARKQRVSGAYLPRPSRHGVGFLERGTPSAIYGLKRNEIGPSRGSGFVYLESNRSGRSLSSVRDCLAAPWPFERARRFRVACRFRSTDRMVACEHSPRPSSSRYNWKNAGGIPGLSLNRSV